MIDRTFVTPLNPNLPGNRFQPKPMSPQLIRLLGLPDSKAIPLLLGLHVLLGLVLLVLGLLARRRYA